MTRVHNVITRTSSSPSWSQKNLFPSSSPILRLRRTSSFETFFGCIPARRKRFVPPCFSRNRVVCLRVIDNHTDRNGADNATFFYFSSSFPNKENLQKLFKINFAPLLKKNGRLFFKLPATTFPVVADGSIHLPFPAGFSMLSRHS